MPLPADGVQREAVTAGVEIGFGAILLALFAPMAWWLRLLVVLAGVAMLVHSRLGGARRRRARCADCGQLLADPGAARGNSTR